MKKYFNIICLVFIALLLNRCASVAPPNGGEKDLEKPYIERTYPKNGTTNYKGNSVKYYFSEWIQEDKLRQQIIITPEIENFEVKIAKNILTLTFDSIAFKANTTYNINLREGIKDLNEGIHSDSTGLVFSTGSYLDSLQINGYIFYGEDNKKSKNISVQLFEASDTFNIERQKPIYSTKTDSASYFQIYNIKPGSYFLYCYYDENSNNKYDRNKEHIGYINNKILLTSSLSIDNIYLYLENYEIPRITFKENKKKSLVLFEYNKDLKDLSVKNLNSSRKLSPALKGKRVILYADQALSDSVKAEFTSFDYYGNNGKDTIGFIVNLADTSQCNMQAVPSSGAELEPEDSIEIFLSKPYNSFKPEIKIKNGKEELSGLKLNTSYRIETHFVKNSISIVPLVPWKDTIKVTVYPISFFPISGYLKDTLQLKYIQKDIEKFGSIGGSITTEKDNLLVQLLSSDNKIVKQVANRKSFLFQYLNDGTYRVRVVIDENKNNQWDQGDYRIRKKPEEIFHYTQSIKLKSSWEILDLNLSF